MPSKLFEGFVLLDPNDTDTYQAVYGSQSYGTYYSVLAHFNVFDSTDEPGKLRIDDISFELVNYRGPVDLFIANAEVKLKQKFKDTQGVEMPEKGIFIQVTVKVNNDPSVDTEKPKFVDLTKLYTDSKDRIVDPNSILLVNRELLSINGSTYDQLPMDGGATGREAVVNGIFDSEFYVRNGSGNFKKKEKADVDLNHPTDASIDTTGEIYEIRLNGGNTPTCRENRARMKYVATSS
ncbi:MAG: hypothetical protein AAFP76_00635 [Bacteroidota bacterium]